MFRHASLNKAFRTIWNDARQCFMAVAEFARSKGSGSAGNRATKAVGAALFCLLGAQATDVLATCANNPQSSDITIDDPSCGAFVWDGTSGSVSISGSGTVTGSAGSFGSNFYDGAVASGGSTSTLSGINNAGLITTNGWGGVLLVQSALMTHGLNNSGVIAGDNHNAIQIGSQAVLAGGVTNSGVITTVTETGIVVYDHGQIQDGIQNSGTISSQYGQAIFVNNASSVSGGINNAAGASISGGIQFNAGSQLLGGFSNAGVIAGGAQNFGFSIIDSVIQDGLTNTGRIIHTAADLGGTGGGVRVRGVGTLSGGLINAGTISSTTYGIQVDNNGLIQGGVTNSLFGLIDGGFVGIGLWGGSLSGGVNNFGTLYGTVAGLFLGGSGTSDATIQQGVTNAGLISGGQAGIALSNGALISGGITNTGEILGSKGIHVNSGLLEGGLVNAGSVSNIYVQNGQITGVTAISGSVGSEITGGITNAGVIAGTSGVAINHQGTATTLNNSAAGTIVGAINGNLDVFNSGLWALQRWSGSAVVDESTTSALLSGNYAQTAGGLLRIGVIGTNGSGDQAGNYSTLSLSGSATFENNANIYLSLNNATAVTAGGTLYGVVSAVSGLTSSGFIIQDNSGLVNFVARITSTDLNIAAVTQPNCSSLTGAVIGPCDVAYDTPNVWIANSGSVTGGATGVRVLAATSGAILGNIVNLGLIQGSNAGVQLTANTEYIGNITNAGSIAGASGGIVLASSSSLSGTIVNQGTIQGNAGVLLYEGAVISNGIHNQGFIFGGGSGPAYGIALGLDARLSGGLLNSGTIAALGDAVYVHTSAQLVAAISNTGWISSLFGSAISASGNVDAIVNDAAVVNGVTHRGLIQGAVRATTDFVNRGRWSLVNASSGYEESFVNNYTQGSNGLLRIGAYTTISGQYSTLTVAGNASFSGDGRIDVRLQEGYTISAGDTLNNVITAGLFGGSLSADRFVVSDNSTIYDFSAVQVGDVLNIVASANATGCATTITGNTGSCEIGVDASDVYVDGLLSGSVNGFEYGIRALDLSNSISNTGHIHAETGPGIRVSTSAYMSGGIFNSGVITSDRGFGIDVAEGAVISGGILNASGGYISSINNAGEIGRSSLLAGIEVYGSSIRGGITNSGLILGGAEGVLLNSGTIQGGLRNYGLIRGNYNGLRFDDSEVLGGVLNSGTIIASGVGLSLYSGSNFSDGLTNSGLIHGRSQGIHVSYSTLTGGIYNSGTISGETGIGIWPEAFVSGGITNTGLIIGTSYEGIDISTGSTVTGGVYNSGTIRGAVGLLIGGGSSQLDGGLTNSGLILGNSGGVAIWGNSVLSGGITNKGVIGALGGIAIVSDNSTNTIDVINTVSGSQVGTIVGAINGYANVSNSGLWVLSNYGTFASVVAGTLNGSYTQETGGTLRLGATGDGSGQYSTLSVSGMADFGSNANIDLRFASDSTLTGANLGTVVSANSVVTNTGTINVTDNSALWDYSVTINSGNQLDLNAVASGACAGSVVGAVTGTCLVAFDAPNLLVDATGTNGGSITGANTGIKVLAGDINGGITNQGYVTGTAAGVLVSASANLMGSIYNSGTFNGAVGISVVQGASVSGGIVNASGSYISSINNSGLISGGQGIQLWLGSEIGNGITNQGSIIGRNETAINIGNSTISGGIRNSGLIQADSQAIRLDASFLTGGLNNTGTIRSVTNTGLYLNESTLVGGVTNSGLITAHSEGIRIRTSDVSGGIRNQGSIISGTSEGIYLFSSLIAGGVSNAGLIQANDSGLRIGNSSVAGGLNNSGTIISQADHGIRIYSASSSSGSYPGYSSVNGGVTNSGLIQGARIGIVLSEYASLSDGFKNTGTVLGDTSGVRIESSARLDGGITNTGLIFANASRGVAIWSGGSLSGGISNSGVISGGGHGIELAGTSYADGIGGTGAFIRNTGSILGGFEFMDSSGIRIADNSQALGDIENIGTASLIRGNVFGINLASGGLLTGKIYNEGSILGTAETGIVIDSNSMMTGGITNLGLIAGGDGIAIKNSNSSVVLEVINTVSGDGQAGTIVGAISGYANVSNSGLWALSNYGTFASVVSGTLVGSYSQETGGTLRFGVTGAGPGEYSSLNVADTASFSTNANLDLRLASTSTLSAGVTLGGVVTAGALSENGFSVTDNSALLDYSAVVVGNSIGLISTNSGACTGNITTPMTGPCLVGFDAPNMVVDATGTNSGSITGGNTGIKVLAGDIDGSITNQGYVASTAAGILVSASANLLGEIFNSGSIDGATGISVARAATISGGIINVTGAYISSINNSGLIGGSNQSIGIVVYNASISGGVTNSGVIAGANVGVKLGNLSRLEGGIDNVGTIMGNLSWAGIVLDSGSTLVGGITNSGIISGYSRGIRLISSSLEGGLFNTGSIYSLSTDLSSDAAGLRLGSSLVSGGITNTGLIAGGYGIYADNGSSIVEGIQNSGTIVGTALAGISLSNSNIAGGVINSGLIQGVSAAIRIDSSSTLVGGVSNTGLIAGVGGIAISNANMNPSNSIDVVNTVSGTQVGTIVGAINGNINVSNSGLWALQQWSGGTIVAGTTASASISGNYVQELGGTLRIGVNGSSGSGTLGGNYSTLNVGGTATFASASGLIVSMSADHSVLAGGTLVGVVTTGGGLSSDGFSISDNSALVDFTYSTATGALDLIAFTTNSGCGATVSGARTGPCDVAFDAPDLYVGSTGSISGGNQGIKVLSGSINGRILNEGYIGGNLTGVQFLAGSSLSGGITNAGSIVGTNVGINVANGAWVAGGIINNAGGYISSINNAGQVGAEDSIYGIHIDSASIGSAITNLGTIIGDEKALRINESSIAGDVSNSGLIIAKTSAIVVQNDSRIQGSIVNTGTLIATDLYSGIYVNRSQVDGAIINHGLIQGKSGGVVLDDTASLIGGLQNTGTIRGLGQGTDGDYAYGLGFKHGSVLQGGITNSGHIQGVVAAISFDSLSEISGGLTNTGVIAGVSGLAIENLNSTSPVEVINTSTGKIFGGIAGYATVSNSGLIALYGYSNPAVIFDDVLTGDYVQDSSGTLRFGAVSTTVGQYSSLNVSGNAIFSPNAFLELMFSNDAVLSGAQHTLVGVINATTLTPLGFIVSDNSALYDYTAVVSGQSVDLVGNQSGACTGNDGAITTAVNGPCLVAFDAPNITVGGGGSISGANFGVEVLAGAVNGSISNSGYIVGSIAGVMVGTSANLIGSLYNEGTIDGMVGVSVEHFGTLSGFNNSGLISGAYYGVGFYSHANLTGGLTNSGTISGIVISSHSTANGVITNSGLIESGIGLYLYGGSHLDSVANSGSIIGTGWQGIKLEDSQISQGITNNGLIQGLLNGVLLQTSSQVSGGVYNAGTIASLLTSGGLIAGFAILDGSQLTGGLTNTGLIEGHSRGIIINGSSTRLTGGLDNRGTVVASGGVGVAVDSGAMLTGGLTNSGLIQGMYLGIHVDRATLTGGVLNSGSIFGYTGVGIWSDAIVSGGITNTGLIIGTSYEGIDISTGSTVTGGVYNSGTIRGTVGLLIGGGSSQLAGGLTNTGLILGNSGGVAIWGNSALSGGITNTGVIGGVNGVAIINDNSSNAINIINTVSGGQAGTIIGAVNGYANVSNSGLWALQPYDTAVGVVAGSLSGNYVQEASGTLRIGATGELVGEYSTVSITGIASFGSNASLDLRFASNSSVSAGATMAGVLTAGTLLENSFVVTDNSALLDFIAVTQTGSINLISTNSGACTGHASPINSTVTGPCLVAFDAPSLQVYANGSISSVNTGIKVLAGDISGGIANAGYVIGGEFGLRVSASANLMYGINNTGTISGPAGIQIDQHATVLGSIFNSGSISNINNYGLLIGVSDPAINISGGVVGGDIVNTGFVEASSGFSAIYFTNSSIGGSIINQIAGTISADSNYALNIEQSTISGSFANRGKIIASNTTAVKIQNSEIQTGINNSGLVFAESRGFDIYSSNILGGINNSGTIISTDDTGLYIRGSTVAGGLTNSGLIDAFSTAIRIRNSDITGDVNNTGTVISAGSTALRLAGSTLSGNVVNSGLLLGDIAGLKVYESQVLGSIQNTGLVTGEKGIWISGASGTSASVPYLNRAILSGSIVNSGTIAGASTGMLINLGQLAGGVTNTGLITGAVGLRVGELGTISGRISNLGSGQIGSIQNEGLIYNSTLIAIDNQNTSHTIEINNTVSGTFAGSIYGAIVGKANVSNSGLWALHAYGDVSATAESIVLGNYAQLSVGTLQLGVNGTSGSGTISGNYSTLFVSGSATFETNSNLNVMMSHDHSVLSGGTLSGVVNALAGITSSGFNISDNSALVNFTYSTVAGTLDLIAFAHNSSCGPTATGDITGPCEVAYDSPDLYVAPGASISGGSLGIRVLSGSITGSISNAGYIAGSQTGIRLRNDATFTGFIANSGTIVGASAGIQISSLATVFGSILNVTGAFVSSITNAGIISNQITIPGFVFESASVGGGFVNTGTINTPSTTGIGYYSTTQSGNIDNSGLIVGRGALAINGSLIQGAINNQGTMLGDGSGVFIGNFSQVTGGITNAGLIQSATSKGMWLGWTTVSGGLQNSGRIVGGASGIGLDVWGLLNNGLDNSGSILGYFGLRMGNALTDSSFNVMTTIAGGITNSGSISGILVQTASLINDGIINSGTIEGNSFGLKLTTNSMLAGGLVNTGYISNVIVENGASIIGDVAISVTGSGVIAGGITNTGFIGASAGLAIVNTNSTSVLEVINTVSGSQSGTIAGAINGYVNVSNAGLWSLQSISGGLIADGSVVHSSISGSYNQQSGGELEIGVTGISGSGTFVGNYSTLALGGSATFAAGSLLSVKMNASDAVEVGGTLAGVITADSGITSSGFTIRDNSALVGFTYSTTSGTLDLIAFATSTGCGETISGELIGPCNLAFDAPNVYVASAGSVGGGSIGIKVLSGSINGRILNEGFIGGSLTGVQFLAGSSLSGGITNSGSVIGAVGINVQAGAAVLGGIVNNSGGYISSINNAGQIGGLSTLTALYLTGSSVSGGITNSGTVVGQAIGLAIHVNGTLSGGLRNEASGLIRGGSRGVSIISSALVGGLTNAGLIEGQSAYGIGLGGSVLTGDLVNLGGTVVGDNFAITLGNTTVAGNLSNTGLIEGLSISGFVIGGSWFTGGLNNEGIIAGAGAGLDISSGSLIDGGITNTGTIVGQGVGINAYNSTLNSGLSNAASGLIRGGSHGLYMSSSTFEGGLTNAGLIQGQTSYGIVQIDSVLTGDLLNLGGTVIGGSDAIYLHNSTITGRVSNTGFIEGSHAAIYLTGTSQVSDGITNSGVIAGMNGLAIDNQSSVGTLEVVNTVSGGQIGTIVGAITGYANVLNSGLWALQSMDGVTIAAGTSVASSISGNYMQQAGGALQIGVNGTSGSGTIAGNYSTLFVGGTASLASGSAIRVMLSSESAVQANGTLVGVVTAAGGLTAGDLSIVDNSALLNFVYETVGGSIDLIAYNATPGNGTISGNVTGPIDVAFDLPNLIVESSGTISGGTQGVIVLPVVSRDVINGIINNQGGIYGNQTGIQFVTGTTLTGGIINTGVISGVAGSGIRMVDAELSGGLANSGQIIGGVNGLFVDPSIINGGITNSGLLQGSTNSGLVLSDSVVNGGIRNLAGGSIVGAVYGLEVIAGSTINGGLTTAGLIRGGMHAIYVDSVSSLQNIVIAGNNTAVFEGGVVAPSTNVSVSNGATFTLNSDFSVSGFSNAGTLVVPAASTVSPVINGNFNNTGTFSPTVNSNTDYTRLTVTGSVSLSGVLNVIAQNATVTAGTTLAGLIAGATTLSGQFASVTDDRDLINFMPVYGRNGLSLAVTPTSTHAIEDALNATGNKAGLGAAALLDSITYDPGAMQPVFTPLYQMTSKQQVSNAVSQMLPQLSGATVWSTTSVLQSINQIIEGRHNTNRGLSTGDQFMGNGNVWMKPFGSWVNQANQNGAYGFKANTGGLILGGDAAIRHDLRLGTAFAWGNVSATSNGGSAAPQSQSSNMYQAVAYGTYDIHPQLHANFQVGGGWNNNNESRSISFMGTSASASYRSALFSAAASVTRPYTLTEKLTVAPTVRMDYTYVQNQAYTETGAGALNLSVNSQGYSTTILGVDGKVAYKTSDFGKVSANAGVGYNFSPTQTQVVAAFAGTPTQAFTVNGVDPGAVMGKAGVGYSYKIRQDLDVGIRYDVNFQSGYTNQTATAKARWSF